MKFKYTVIDNKPKRLMNFCQKCWNSDDIFFVISKSKRILCEICVSELEKEDCDFALGIESLENEN